VCLFQSGGPQAEARLGERERVRRQSGRSHTGALSNEQGAWPELLPSSTRSSWIVVVRGTYGKVSGFGRRRGKNSET
ncbi:hypothetical protein KIL84_017473, partial [Mauremys mutica]